MHLASWQARGSFGLTPPPPIVACNRAIGSTLCYQISAYFGKDLLERYALERLLRYRRQVKENEGNLFIFMMGLRVVPLVPNWMINVASPHVGVPWFHIFFPALFGLMPYNFLFIQAGNILSRLTSTGDIVDATTLFQFGLLGAVTIGISVFRSRRMGKSKHAAES